MAVSYRKDCVPMLRLTGKYLIDNGFSVGQRINVSVEERKIVIVPLDDELENRPQQLSLEVCLGEMSDGIK